VIKTISQEIFDQHQFCREIEALVHLNHPCILRILGWSPPTHSHSAEIHTEYAENKSLDRVLNQGRCGATPSFWTATGKMSIVCGVIIGMRYVHRQGYIHRDLKPSNILINGRGEAMISDFGTSRLECDDNTLTPDSGTVHYAAPEQFYADARCTRSVDVFSFGSILYEIVSGSPVFARSEPPHPIMRKLFAGDMPRLSNRHENWIQMLISRCWSKDPESRPSFDDIRAEFHSRHFGLSIQ
jgi:serine/threonine protein kinase